MCKYSPLNGKRLPYHSHLLSDIQRGCYNDTGLLKKVNETSLFYDMFNLSCEYNQLKRFESAQIRYLVYGTKLFPTRLYDSYYRPGVLLLYGDTTVLSSLEDYTCISIVGSRVLDESSSSVITTLLYNIFAIKEDTLITTGGAHGVDILATRSALEMGLKCIVVVPQITKRIKDLLEEFVVGLLVIALYPSKVPIYRYMFLDRNWIVSSLCDCLVYVKGASRSGSMSSANYARKMGREVYVYDGFDPLNQSYSGNLSLLERGCKNLRLLYNKLDILI